MLSLRMKEVFSTFNAAWFPNSYPSSHHLKKLKKYVWITHLLRLHTLPVLSPLHVKTACKKDFSYFAYPEIRFLDSLLSSDSTFYERWSSMVLKCFFYTSIVRKQRGGYKTNRFLMAPFVHPKTMWHLTLLSPSNGQKVGRWIICSKVGNTEMKVGG